MSFGVSHSAGIYWMPSIWEALWKDRKEEEYKSRHYFWRKCYGENGINLASTLTAAWFSLPVNAIRIK